MPSGNSGAQALQQRICDRIGLHVHSPGGLLAQIKPAERRNSIVFRRLFLRLMSGLRLAVNHVTEVGMQTLVDSSGYIQIIQQMLAYFDNEMGLLAHLALHASLWRLIAFQPATGQQPVAAAVSVVTMLDQQNMIG
jgi:hypothetical protein